MAQTGNSRRPNAPTTDLVEALNRFDPLHPLQTDEELESFYISREGSPLAPLASFLSAKRQPVKILFMGHRGSGKSTELARLASQMGDQFLVVHFHAGQILNINDLEPVDVILGCALALLKYAFVNKVDYELALWTEIEEWLRNEVLRETTKVESAEKSGGLSLKAFVGHLSAKWNAESATRKTVRPRLQSALSDLVVRMNQVIDHIRSVLGKPPLLLVEDLDKTGLGQAKKVFFEEGHVLRLLDCAVVYTFPIALRYSNDFAQIRHNFEDDFKLPNVKIRYRDGTPCKSGLASLRELALRRADESLFASGALERAIDWSGGLMIDFVRLLQDSFLRAIVEKRGQITDAMVDAVAAEIRNDFRAALRSEHYEALRRCSLSHRVINEVTVQEALHNLSLLEYKNTDEWCDVHPIARPLLDD